MLVCSPAPFATNASCAVLCIGRSAAQSFHLVDQQERPPPCSAAAARLVGHGGGALECIGAFALGGPLPRSERSVVMARPALVGICLILLAACSGVGLRAEGSEHDVDWTVKIGRASCRERVCQYV